MADNYLEKRYAEVFGGGAGRPACAPARPSLDSLLSGSRPCDGFIEGYPVNPAQLDAILASASKVGPLFCCSGECTAEGAVISVSAGDSVLTPALFVSLGALLQTICLKTTELHLNYSWSLRPEGDPVAVVKVGKASNLQMSPKNPTLAGF